MEFITSIIQGHLKFNATYVHVFISRTKVASCKIFSCGYFIDKWAYV